MAHRPHSADGSGGTALAGSAVGTVLHGVFAAVGRLRPDKPLHPRGVVRPATVTRFGTSDRFGVPWLDDPGRDPALIRFSRSVGLPAGWPDVLGIALRVTVDARPADLLFATTGSSPVGRFLLRPRRAAAVGTVTYSTLQPYRTPSGPVVLAARPTSVESGLAVRLAVARPTGRWHDFGSVTVEGDVADGADASISFDPILNPVPGLTNYQWVERVREGAYLAARRSRDRAAAAATG